MKVKELIGKCHLVKGQKTKINVRAGNTYTSSDRYCFDHYPDFEQLLKLKVTTFECSDGGVTIWAEQESN